jgi:hypothetical protein
MFVIDVIGIVLAVAPLLIEAGKFSHNVAGNAKLALNPSKHREFVDEFFRDLSYELTMFRMSLEKLVLDLNVDHQTQQDLLQLLKQDHQDVQQWTKPSQELQDKFESRLGSSMETFMLSLEGIMTELAKLIKETTRGLSVPPKVRYCDHTPININLTRV